MSESQVNLESIFRFLYDLIHGQHTGDGGSGYSLLQAYFAHIWLWIIIIGYALALAGMVAIVYITVRLFELRKREEAYYSTVIAPTEATGGMNPRWEHIQSLLDEASPSSWREAIIEADIMLDDTLARRGYVGDGVGEKLKAVDPSEMRSLQDAWEVHKVRNQIAHEGSAFDLSELVARRTIARYESIFRELKEI